MDREVVREHGSVTVKSSGNKNPITEILVLSDPHHLDKVVLDYKRDKYVRDLADFEPATILSGRALTGAH